MGFFQSGRRPFSRFAAGGASAGPGGRPTGARRGPIATFLFFDYGGRYTMALWQMRSHLAKTGAFQRAAKNN
jgi:hypothetical protein